MASERRRRKKNAKRGRIAQPPIQRESSGQLIPGVPAFQQGGEIGAGGWGGPATPWWQRVQQSPFEGFDPEAMSDVRTIRTVMDQLGVDEQTAMWVLREASSGDVRKILGLDFSPSGGGAGGSLPPAWRPGEFGLEERGLGVQEERNRLTQQSQQLQAEIGREQMALERYIADRRQDEANRSQRRIEQLQQQRLQLDQQIAGIDRDIQQQRIGVDVRGQDIGQRGQDINAELQQLGFQLQLFDMQRRDALERGDQQLAQDIEGRMRAAQEQQGLLTQRQQDVQMRGQDIGAQADFNQQQLQDAMSLRDYAIQVGNQNLEADAEKRIRAHQQQQVALQQFQAQMQGAELGLEGVRGGGSLMGQLAQSLGQIEAGRASELAELAANPRDWVQMQYALGGGESFLNNLIQGQPIGAQSATQGGGTPLLGPGFERLTEALTTRRDLPFFEEAAEMARQQAQYGGQIPGAPSLDMLLGLGQMPGVTPRPGAPPGASLTAPNLPGIGREQLPGMPPMQSGPPPSVAPPNLGFTPPARIEQPGPMSTLTPGQQGTFEEVTRRAPGVPRDIREDWARRPGDFAQYFAGLTGGGLAKGGQVMIDEPAVLMGMKTGMPLATMSEPTEQFPDGAPEMMEVKPMAQGGQISRESKYRGFEPPTQRRSNLATGSQPRGIGAITTPGNVRTTRPSGPGGTAFGPGFQLPDQQPRQPISAIDMAKDAFARGQQGPISAIDLTKDIYARGRGQPGGGVPISTGPVSPLEMAPPPIQPVQPVRFGPSLGTPKFGGGGLTPRQLPPGGMPWITPQDQLRPGGGLQLQPGAPGGTPFGPGFRPFPMPQPRPQPGGGGGPRQIGGYNPWQGPAMPPGVQPIDTGPVQLPPQPQPIQAIPPSQFPAPTPVGGGRGYDPNEIIRNIIGGLTPRSYNNMFEPQRQMTAGLFSALGMDPGIGFQTAMRSWPTAPDPSRIWRAGF